MVGLAHTLTIVTKNLKIYEISASGGEPTTLVRGGWRCGTRWYPYTEVIKVDADILMDTNMIGLLRSHMMCMFYVCGVAIYTTSYKGRYPNRVLYQHNLGKNYKYLETCRGHRWELMGNCPDFIVVMVIYHYVNIILMIIITPNCLYNI